MQRFPVWIKLTFLTVMILILSFGLLFYRNQEGYRRTQIEEELASIASLKADGIAVWRQERVADGATLTEDLFLFREIVQWFTTKDPIITGEIKVVFQSLMKHYRYYEIIILSADGEVQLSFTGINGSVHPEILVAAEKAFASRAPEISELHVSVDISVPHISVVTPLFSGSDPVGSVVMVSDASSFLYPLIQSWPTPTRTAETLLIRTDGDSVKFLNELRHTKNTALKLRIPLTRTDVPAVMAAQGRQGVVEGLDYRGVDVIAVILPVPDSPWFIVSKIDKAEALSSWRFQSILILSIIFGLVILVAVGLLFLWQRGRKMHYRDLYNAEAKRLTSEARYGITIKGIGDAVISTDAEGLVEILNPIAEELTGWNIADAKGRPLQEVFRTISEGTREVLDNPADRVLREGGIMGLANSTILIARDGTERSIADSRAPIIDEKGELIGMVLVFRDQTEERKTREALLDGEARAMDTSQKLTAIVEHTPMMLVYLDADFNFKWVNKAYADTCRFEPSWFPGKNHFEMYPHEENKAIFQHVVDTGESFSVLAKQFEFPDQPERGVTFWDWDLVPVMDLSEKVVGLVFSLVEVTDRIAAEKNYRMLFREMLDGFALHEIILDEEGIPVDYRFLDINPAFERLTGLKASEIKGKTVLEVMPETEKFWIDIYGKVVLSGEPAFFKNYAQVLDRHFEVTAFCTAPLRFVTIFKDVTDRVKGEKTREKLQVQLAHSQKMESVGKLAGGVAHDFNNMLGVILGHTELAMKQADESGLLYEDLTEIYRAAERSADLTRQLLAYASKQTVSPKILDLNETVEGMLKMLERLIGENIDLAWLPGKGLWPIKMDPGQIDQVLANLCINACDAIPDVGKVTIETLNVSLDDKYCADHHEFIPGDYVMLGVSDDGQGMDGDILEHVFEPFFTTKNVGSGTGLGLSTVYGIVKQNCGFINVYSEPGEGSTFKIYLSRCKEEMSRDAAQKDVRMSESNGETILLVEDEESILKLGKKMLNVLGYEVLTANSPVEAIRIAENHSGEINLMITDVVMPNMNGRALATRMGDIIPGLQCLYMSGYTANVIARKGILDEGVHFLQKPFSIKELAEKVQDAIKKQ
ncbi:MAG: PAS domain S-box protein [Bacteroidales bacterium]|nr:PAS domain S-box protein [Candidatus Latescibacterota bacterium]